MLRGVRGIGELGLGGWDGGFGDGGVEVFTGVLLVLAMHAVFD